MKKICLLILTALLVLGCVSCSEETTVPAVPAINNTAYYKMYRIISALRSEATYEDSVYSYTVPSEGLEINNVGTLQAGSTFSMTIYLQPTKGYGYFDCVLSFDAVLKVSETETEHLVVSYSTYTGIMNINGTEYTCPQNIVRASYY